MSLAIVLALLLDQLLGEPRRYHPLIGFGSAANFLEATLNRGLSGRLRGLLALLLLTLPLASGTYYLSVQLGPWFDIAALYLCIGSKSLVMHARKVVDALARQDLERARVRVGRMVSRDTNDMTQPAIVTATIESLLENGADAVFGALFWFMVAGAPGAVFYRLVNTLDAMWGYKTARFHQFGWAAARLDDLLNWIPARLTALGYAVSGEAVGALRSWRQHAGLLESPNGGVVMSAGAGALGLRLGGPAFYHGSLRPKPWFGGCVGPVAGDIYRAIDLIQLSLFYWILLLFFGTYCFA